MGETAEPPEHPARAIVAAAPSAISGAGIRMRFYLLKPGWKGPGTATVAGRTIGKFAAPLGCKHPVGAARTSPCNEGLARGLQCAEPSCQSSDFREPAKLQDFPPSRMRSWERRRDLENESQRMRWGVAKLVRQRPLEPPCEGSSPSAPARACARTHPMQTQLRILSYR